MTYKLGILDQSPIFPNETATEAFSHTIQLAKDAEKWGYKRFWVSEHHHMEHVAGSSPEILMAHILAHTNTIHIGSGGVMLQHYSPYKVVENFHVLASLAPGRIDLGVGKAPGGLDLSTKALQYEQAHEVDFTEKLTLVNQFLHDDIPIDHTLSALQAKPQPPVRPSAFLLGGSKNSAELAGKRRMNFVFARFLNSNDKDLAEAVERFRQLNPSGTFIVALTVVAAETKEEADQLAEGLKLYDIKFQNNRTITVQSYDQVEAQRKQTTEPFDVQERKTNIIAGTASQIKDELDALFQNFNIDEFMFHTPLLDKDARQRSFASLSPQHLLQDKNVYKKFFVN